MALGWLAAAIVVEVTATLALHGAARQTCWWYLVAGVGYLVAFYFLAQALRTLDTSIAYAIWSGLGLVLTVIATWIMFGERPTLVTSGGIFLIGLGVVILTIGMRDSNV